MIGKCYLPGSTLALDGFVIEIRKPTEAEVNVLGNFNRKGYYRMVALSAVDVYGHFLYSELEYSGSANDDKAILYSELDQSLLNNELPDH
jgi:predicted metal-dependent phosphotriesterase family hydrolase